ncbi:hypothetical protein ACFZDK_53380 [Streptomyces sp. NPDC007901]|uniref:hypothetical protein n=1 Tax=Streptomyces sp. NPDC007901 TaxID=3364785 RepID=UPI0036EFE630
MTSPGTRRTTAAVVLALAVALNGCGNGAGGGRTAPAEPSRSAATGTGPYPTPSGAGEASALPARSTGAPEHGASRASDVDRSDPDAVSKGALTALWTFDTVTDDDPFAADVRAADGGWLTAAYADELRSHRAESVRDVQWRQWTTHRARTTVALAPADDAAKPADTRTEAWRQWAVTTTPHGRDHWTGKPTTVAAYVHLTRTGPGKPWRVAGVLLQ